MPFITREEWDLMVQSYREKPGNYTQAAKAAGCDPRKAKQAWLKGYSQVSVRGFASKPIKDLLEEEEKNKVSVEEKAQLEARVREIQEREKAKREAADQRALEGQMVRLAKGNAMRALSASAHLLESGVKLAQRVKGALEQDTELAPGTAIGLVARVVGLARQATESASQVMEMERLFLGEPGKVIELQVGGGPASVEEAAEIIERANRALERARQRGVAAIPAVATVATTPDPEPIV